MALHDYLDEVLGSKASVRVLRALVRYKGKVFTVRELARVSGVSHPAVSTVVKDLERRGIVKLQPVGRAHQVILNGESYALKSIVEPMVKAEENTLSMLVATIRLFFKEERVTSVAIFGSVAKGLETRTSDVDLLVVTDDRESANDSASRASTASLARFGIGLSPFISTRAQFVRRQRGDFARSVMASYRMVLGKDIRELVLGVQGGQ